MDEGERKHTLKLGHRIGNGAFGDVFRGTYDGEIVAVKTSRAPQNGEDEAYRMFAREARMLQQCSHRSIIGFRALCRMSSAADSRRPELGGKWALVLEYAKGGTLSDKVSTQMMSPSRRIYSDAQALGWALDVASALEHLHQHSPAVMHRDIKLSNVVLSSAEGQVVAKLSDFGLHVVADDKRDRLMRVSVSLDRPDGAAGVDVGPGSARRRSVSFTALPPGFAPDRPFATAQRRTPDDSAHSSDGAQWQGPAAKAGTAAAADAPAAGGCGAAAAMAPAPAAGSAGSGWSDLTQQHVQELQQQLAGAGTQQAPPDTNSTSLATRRGSAAAPDPAHHLYGELHDSGGSMPFVYGVDAAGARLAAGSSGKLGSGGVLSRTQSCTSPGLIRGISDGSAQADDVASLRRAPPRRGVSFRLESLAGDQQQQQQQQQPAYSRWGRAPPGWHADDCQSVCSMVTDGTWVSDGTTLTDGTMLTDGSTATEGTGVEHASDAWGSSDGDAASVDTELVFNLTGQTGSLMAMAPEVFVGEPYNEKADVFSFGVLLFEIMSRCLLIFTELPTTTSDPSVTEDYARKVAGGYRPKRPKRIRDEVWDLVEACWQQEPILRPSMSKVVDALQELLAQEVGGGKGASAVARHLEARGRDGGGASAAGAAAKAPAGAGAAPPTPRAAPEAAGCGCVIC